MFTSAVTVIYIFAILGMDQTYIRYYYKKGVDRRELMRRCLLPALLIVCILCLVYGLFAGFVNDFLFGERGTQLTVLVISYTVISVFERFLFLDIRMSQNGKLYSNLNIASKLIYIILIIIFAALLGDDFRVVMWAMTISLGLITLIVGIRYLVINAGKDMVNEYEIKPYVLDQKELVSYGLPFILVLLMEWLLSSCDKWSLRLWSDYGELGIYNCAMSIMSILLTFKATFVAFWSPVAMEKYEQGLNSDIAGFFKTAFNITRCLCGLAGVGIILFRGVIVLILGEDYRTAVKVMPFLTLMPVFSILFEITNQGIKFVKKNRYLNYASLVAIVFNIMGNYILVERWGGAGAALATAITYLAYFAVGSYFSEKCYKVGYDWKRTIVYAVLLFVYAFQTTFLPDAFIDILLGLIIIFVILVMDRHTVALCIDFISGNIKKCLKKEK